MCSPIVAYMQKLDELMRDTANTLLLYYLKMHFIGSSGIGKSTTKKRLTGQIMNVASLPEKERKRCSTYLAEFNQVLAMMDVGTLKLTLKISDNPIEEMRDIFAYVYSSQTTVPDHTPSPAEISHSSDQHPSDGSDQPQPHPHPLNGRV